MKYSVLLLTLLFVLAACSSSAIIEEKEYIIMTISNELPQANNNWGNGEKIVITDRTTIMNIIDKINNSAKKDLSKISWEHGPELRIVFEDKNKNYREIKAFISGTVVTDKYAISAGINFDELIND
ncbi:hypothetical protein E3U55_14750 [Filobacillus milosensis]|uniref:DUF3221 domain-containing protein n=1 Tax=Filobacillus milosensis TaxID=94137 RepID=A0A4Y8IDQ8_9BACI|nr:hypothetical protein [Filobacillus milosensis]TFB14040.1 hypothetical protein E3U55_14750 [Filobacillus milosensis]